MWSQALRHSKGEARPGQQQALPHLVTLLVLGVMARGSLCARPSAMMHHHTTVQHNPQTALGGSHTEAPSPTTRTHTYTYKGGWRPRPQVKGAAVRRPPPSSERLVSKGKRAEREGDTLEMNSSRVECTLSGQGVATPSDYGSPSSSSGPEGPAHFCPGVGAGNDTDAAGGAWRCPHSKPSRCRPGCETHGTCNQELGRCDCPRGRSGEACERGVAEPSGQEERFAGSPPMCLNECNRLGSCVFGFCHCKPGFFGSDCSLWLDQSDRPHLLHRAEWGVARGHRPLPRVYVYNLPPEYNVYFDARRLDRNAELFFYERMLTSHHRTADAGEADLFMVPVPTRLTEQVYGLQEGGHVLTHVLDYIAHTWPSHVARNAWRDHVFFFSGDWGTCEYFPNNGDGENFPEAIRNGISITYWGLASASSRYSGGGPCYFAGKDVVMPPINSYNNRELSPFHPDVFAARMGTHDVPFMVKKRNPTLVPGPTEGGALVTPLDAAWGGDAAVGATEVGANPVRRWLLYFAGKTTGGSKGYTCRQRAKKVLSGREAEGIRFLERDPMHYEENLAASTFCLAPTGSGWGRRTTLAATFGCIPVVVQDNVAQPFDDVLPYERFSVRVAENDLEKLPEILRAIPMSCEGVGPEGRCVPRMREQLACAVRSFLWSSVFGSTFGEGGEDDAFAVTMLSLQHRVATYVKPREHATWTPQLPLTDACQLSTALSCQHVDQPICRFPCDNLLQSSGRAMVRSAGMRWPPGGARCAHPADVRLAGKRTCD